MSDSVVRPIEPVSGDSEYVERLPLKRRRKRSSCDSCRKLKTRCDFEPATGKCHRCNMLKIDCSLYQQSNGKPAGAKAGASESAIESVYDNDDERLDKIERQLGDVLEKLDTLRTNGLTQSSSSGGGQPSNVDYQYISTLGKRKWNHLDNSTTNAPSNVISRIDSKLFGRVDQYHSFTKVCESEFLKSFYAKNKDLCLKLGSNFLTIAHFWIVPGGIREITDDYVLRHPFISAVFVLLAMGFDENYSYVEEQRELFWIVRRLLAMALITSPLTDHDVEAILYCSLYNIARKPSQPLLDNWMVSSDGIKQMMYCTSFQKIEDRCKSREYKQSDLFHLRIWTLLCICHLQCSIGNGRPSLISKDYMDICDRVIDYPWSNLEDNVNAALVRLAREVHKMFYSKDLISNLIRDDQIANIEGVKCFSFKELHDWRNRWKELIDNDLSGTLLFNYDFYHIILSRRFIASFKGVRDYKVITYINVAYNTAVHYSRAILNRFLQLPKSMVKGSPCSLLNEVVYSCLTLYDFQGKFETQFNMRSLNLVSRVYWHLNHVGETKNDATDTVGQIIKTLVDVRIVNTANEPSASNSTDPLALPDNLKEFEMDYKPLHDEISHEYTSDIRLSSRNSSLDHSGLTAMKSGELDELLDVDKFETFEDFFRGIVGK